MHTRCTESFLSIIVCLELHKEIAARLRQRYRAANIFPVYYIASKPRPATFFDQAQAYFEVCILHVRSGK